MMEFLEQRNRDFMAAVDRVIADRRYRNKSLREKISIAAAGPAPMYYVSFSHVMKGLPGKQGGEPPVGENSMRRAMWEELLERVNRRRLRSGVSRADAVSMVLAEGNASSFFITPGTAWVIYHSILSHRRHCHRPRRSMR